MSEEQTKKERRSQYNKTYHEKYLQKHGVKYFQDHREEINRYRREKIECEICGSKVNRSAIYLHNKSKKHQNKIIDNSAEK